MPASQPRVIAIVVNHNGRAFLRDTFRGLAAQTRPIDDVLVVDTGSTDGSADWARSRLGDDAVMAVRGQFGRAVMSALRDPRTSGMDWLWLLHDDCAPEPEALERLMAEAESRPSASILGPKLVSWTNPDRLQEIGFSIDRTGRAVSQIEDDEIDQGQHDQIRDVFFVNTAGMLVRRGALLNVGGFDERMPAFRDDLDLCWRTHLTGGRVLVVPQSRVRHFAAASSRSRRTRAVGHPRYLIERHTLAAMLKATSLRKLPLALLLAMVGALVRSASLALTGRPADALAVLWAWGWNVKELPVTIVHRRRLQRQRKVDDSALAPLRAPGGQRLKSLLRGTLELVYGAEVGAHVAQRADDSGEEQDMPSRGVGAAGGRRPPGGLHGRRVRPGHGHLAALGAVRPGDRQHQPGGLAGHRHRAAARVRLQLPPGPDGLDRLRAAVAGPARGAVGADLRQGPGGREAAPVAGPAAGRGHLHPGPAGGGAPAVGPGPGRAAVRDRPPGHRRPGPGPHR